MLQFAQLLLPNLAAQLPFPNQTVAQYPTAQAVLTVIKVLEPGMVTICAALLMVTFQSEEILQFAQLPLPNLAAQLPLPNQTVAQYPTAQAAQPVIPKIVET